MRTNRIQALTSKKWCYIALGLFFMILMASCRNTARPASDKLSQSTFTAAVDESYQEDKPNRIVYAPNGDIVDVESVYIPADTNDIYMVVEDPPEFPGGLQALSDYLRDNINYPETCRKDSIQGRVIITFVVEKDGSISSAEVVKSVHEKLDTEALRVINAMPKWKPGKQRGKVVRVEYAIPVKFKLDGSPYLTVPKRPNKNF
jgi:TonB family protein